MTLRAAFALAVAATLARALPAAAGDVVGSGVDLLGRSRPLHLWEEAGADWLVDASKPTFDPTSDPPSPATTRGALIVLDAQHGLPDADGDLRMAQISAPSPTLTGAPAAVSAAFGLSETYDYLRERHGRSGLDGAGGGILAVVRFGQGAPLAFWSGTTAVFGDGTRAAAALDVVAHVLAHGVIQHTARLWPTGEAGAVAEGMADVLGEAVEARTAGRPDWLVGAVAGAPVRNLRDPAALLIPGASRAYPARLRDRIAPDDPLLDALPHRDDGGVHLNATIVGHAFYLLADGLSDAIGLRDATAIFYRTLATHLTAGAGFLELRLAANAVAEELFGPGSPAVRAVAHAFDAVEIPVHPERPGAPSTAAVAAPDALLFLRFDGTTGGLALRRVEAALGDPPAGTRLGLRNLNPARPAVSRDGSVAAFVDAENDACVVPTDGSAAERCLGRTGQVRGVALSADGRYLGVVDLRGDGGEEPVRSATIVDLAPGGVTQAVPLRGAARDGDELDAVQFSDAIELSADGRFLVYDAFNAVVLTDGSVTGAWSIYARDLEDGTTRVLVPPAAGVELGYPQLARTTDGVLVYDAFDSTGAGSTVYALDLATGARRAVASVAGGFAVPSYTGDDGGVVFTRPDASATGGTLLRQAVGVDRGTPVGVPVPLLADAAFGVVYRRGPFTPPARCEADASCDAGDPCTVDTCDSGAGCTHAARTGVASVTCAFERTLGLSLCVDAPAFRRVDRRLAQARSLIERSDGETTRRARRRLRAAARRLAAAGRVAARLGQRGRLHRTCVGAVAALVTDGRGRAETLATGGP